MDCFVVSVAYGTAALLVLCSLVGLDIAFQLLSIDLANSSYIHLY